MPWRYVEQPDGKLAIFSTIVDDFTDMNMTEEQAIEVGRMEGASQEVIAAKILRAREAGVQRWVEALDIIQTVHGHKVRMQRVIDAGAMGKRADILAKNGWKPGMVGGGIAVHLVNGNSILCGSGECTTGMRRRARVWQHATVTEVTCKKCLKAMAEEVEVRA